MKKVIFLTLGLLASNITFSQGTFKPTAGDMTFDLSFDSPFSSSKPISLINGFKYRYLLSETYAFRSNLNITSNKNKSIVYGIDDKGNTDYGMKGISTSKNLDLNLRLGIEKHLNGTDRLDPYLGADLILGLNSIKSERDKNNSGTYQNDYEYSSKQLSSNLGLSLIAGFDFYLVENIYFGTEFGLTYNTSFSGDEEIKETSAGTSTETINKSSGSLTSIVTGMTTGAFRIGYRF